MFSLSWLTRQATLMASSVSLWTNCLSTYFALNFTPKKYLVHDQSEIILSILESKGKLTPLMHNHPWHIDLRNWAKQATCITLTLIYFCTNLISFQASHLLTTRRPAVAGTAVTPRSLWIEETMFSLYFSIKCIPCGWTKSHSLEKT